MNYQGMSLGKTSLGDINQTINEVSRKRHLWMSEGLGGVFLRPRFSNRATSTVQIGKHKFVTKVNHSPQL